MDEPKRQKVYVVLTSKGHYYAYDLEVAEQAARDRHGELRAFADLDAALDEFNLTPLDEDEAQ